MSLGFIFKSICLTQQKKNKLFHLYKLFALNIKNTLNSKQTTCTNKTLADAANFFFTSQELAKKKNPKMSQQSPTAASLRHRSASTVQS